KIKGHFDVPRASDHRSDGVLATAWPEGHPNGLDRPVTWSVQAGVAGGELPIAPHVHNSPQNIAQWLL
ncbi:MAG: hypothetical protein K8T91_25865, partial [Planctomycetes bacterium]|nr:hypothetical protein [Planctomycetota bacterium]